MTGELRSARKQVVTGNVCGRIYDVRVFGIQLVHFFFAICGENSLWKPTLNVILEHAIRLCVLTWKMTNFKFLVDTITSGFCIDIYNSEKW